MRIAAGLYVAAGESADTGFLRACTGPFMARLISRPVTNSQGDGICSPAVAFVGDRILWSKESLHLTFPSALFWQKTL